MINRALQRLQGLVWGDGTKDTSIYIEDNAVTVDAYGRDVGAYAFRVRGLSPQTNAPTVLFQVDKDGTIATTGTNPLTNAGVEVWQRGAGPYSANNAFAADRWQLSVNGTSTLSVSQDTANVDAGSRYCAACTHVQGNATNLFFQVIEDYYQFRGRSLTFAARVKTTTANAVRLSVFDGTTRTTGAYHTGSGVYETLTVTVALPASAPSLQVEVGFLNGNVTAYVDNATLAGGQSAMPYQPITPAVDLVQCQRYYTLFGGLDTNEYGIGLQCISTTVALGVWRFPVEMAVAPTITGSAAADFSLFNAAGSLVACTVIAANNPTRRSTRLTLTVASGLVAGNASVLLTNTTTARLSAESNP